MDKNIPFPECAKNCEVVKMLGVGECESVCEHKFDTSGRQLTIPAVMKSVCGCDKPKPMARNLDEAITCITCRKVIEQTVLQHVLCMVWKPTHRLWLNERILTWLFNYTLCYKP